MDFVGYYRVSTKRQGRSGLGLEAQQHSVREFAEAHEILVAKLDRFSRRVSFIGWLMEQRVALKVVEMPNASTFQLHIHAALAEEERRMISARENRGVAEQLATKIASRLNHAGVLI